MSNYQGRLEDSQANKLLVTPHSMANIEDSDTASQIYTVGNMLVFNNRLCKVTAAIAQGDTLEVGTNIAYKGINDIGQQLCASDGKEFYFDVKDGEYGYYPSASKVLAEFVPFGGTGAAIKIVSGITLYDNQNTETVNVTSIYPNYANLTADNFVIEMTAANMMARNIGSSWVSGYTIYTKSYDATTGILTYKLPSRSNPGMYSMTCNVWLVVE